MDNKIYITVTLYHKIIYTLSILLMVGTFIYLLIAWNQLPDKIPGHFNSAGEIDRWGSKYELFITPVISVFIFLGITLLEKHPEGWNTGVNVTKNNKDRVYKEIKNMIVTLKFLVILTFTFITVYSSLAIPLPASFLPAAMILIFGSMIYFLVRLVKGSK